MTKDLTIGKPSKVLWMFCLPLFLSMIFQQLYNIADSLIAGKFIGENALAAVGNSYEITLIFIAFAFGCNIGCSVIVSRYFGGKDITSVKTTIFTSLILTAATCVTLMALGLLLCDNLLRLIKTPEEVMGDSKLYLDIYLWGLPFIFFYNLCTGIFSGLGDSKTPLLFLMASSLANVGMDIAFVAGLKMGVAGVAWATFICQGVSCVLSLIVVLFRLKKLNSDGKPALFSWKIAKEIGIIAIPSVLQQSFISVGNIIIQGVINGFGAAVMAGYSASIKLNNLVITSFTTLGTGVSNFTAQNLGAKKEGRVSQGYKAGLVLVLCIALPIILTYVLAGPYILHLFVDSPSEEAIHSGAMLLWILAPFYPIVAIKLVTDGIIRGAGKMGFFMSATFTDLLLRVILAILFSKTSLGYVGIWMAWPFGWGVASILSLIFYFRLPFHKEKGEEAAKE